MAAEPPKKKAARKRTPKEKADPPKEKSSGQSRITEEIISVLGTDEDVEKKGDGGDVTREVPTGQIKFESHAPEVVVSKDSSLKFWILQAKADTFDFRNDFGPGSTHHWEVANYQRQVQVGDIAFFWKTAPHRGIYGWGKVTSLPKPMEDRAGHFEFDVRCSVFFLFPIPLATTQQVIGEKHRLFSFKNDAIFQVEEQSAYHLFDVALLYGNSSANELANSLSLPLADEVIARHTWLQDLVSESQHLSLLSVVSSGAWACIRYTPPNLPSKWVDEQRLQGLTLLAIDGTGLYFEMLFWQLALLEQHSLSQEYRRDLDELLTTLSPDLVNSSDENLRVNGGDYISFEEGEVVWKQWLLLAERLIDRLKSVDESILAKLYQWIKDPDTLRLNETSGPIPDPPREASGLQFAQFALTDSWTTQDLLGYRDYALAAAEFLNDERTKAPLAISIQAPWGAGKTSLMKMIQQELDPAYEDIKTQDAPARTSYRQVTGALGRMGKPGEGHDQQVTASEQGWISVWFNPWKYEESDQIWAGLADTIIRDFADRMSSAERELFYLDLNLRRIDTQALRNDIHKAMLTTTARYSLIGFALALAALPVITKTIFGDLLPSDLFGKTTTFGVSGGALGALVGYIKKNAESAAASLPEYIRIPNYSERQGFRQTAAEDIARVFRGHRDKPGNHAKIIIFIDDLDRCSPKKIAHVFEAINHFVADRDLKCFVVLGMDGEIVSAALQKHYKDLFEEAPSHSRSGSIGWYYLDKFVQIPFVIPTTDKDQLLYMAQRAGDQDDKVEEEDEEEEAKKTVRSRISSVLATTQIRMFGAHLASLTPVLGRNLDQRRREKATQLHTNAIQEISTEKAGKLQQRSGSADKREWLDQQSKHLTDDELLKKIWDVAQWNFNNNPRTIKRCLNLTRFFYLIHGLRTEDGQPVPDEDALIRWIYFAFRWPDAARWIQSGRSTSPDEDEAPETRSEKRIAQVYNDAKAPDTDTSIWNVKDGPGKRLVALHPWLADEDLKSFCRDHFHHIQQHAGQGFW